MELILDGLSCPTCSVKIQQEIKKLPQVSCADYNAITNKLNVELRADTNKEEIQKKIESIVHYYEPEVCVIDPQELKPSGEVKEQVGSSFTKQKKNLVSILGILLFVVGFIIEKTSSSVAYSYVLIGAYLLAYLIIGGEILLKSARNIAKGKVFDENFLMSVATIGAMFLGQYTEGVAVMLFYRIGEELSEYAQNKSIRSINQLLKLKIPYANLVCDESTEKVPCENVQIGDLLLVKSGEQIPVDSIVVSGSAYADTKSVTGEPVLRYISSEDEVYAGYVVTDGPITVRAVKKYEDSMIAKIIYLTKEASQNKSKTEKFITKFAAYYTPAVVIGAVLLSVIPPILGYGTFAQWINRGLIFLVISCPCALVLSIPLGYFAGIGAASKQGILIKGANFLETLAKVKVAVFDKTGTLTQGSFAVQEMYANVAIDIPIEECFAAAEHYSNHPIAKSIREHYKGNVDEKDISEYKEYAGKGVSLIYRGNGFKAGTAEFTGTKDIVNTLGRTAVYLTLEGKAVGYCILADVLKADTADAIRMLHRIGVEKTVMLTGDRLEAAKHIADQIGIDEVKANLLPDQKVKAYSEIFSQGTIMYAGDGINDAPVLAMADVGIAMGALGSDAAIEAADIVVMTDSLSEVAKAVRIAKYTRRIIFQNIVFVLGVKVFFLGLGALGIATMGEAVFADVGTALIATLNAMRIFNRKD